MNLEERLRCARAILRELRYGPLAWSELERRVLANGGTHWKFTSLMGWLTDNGYIFKDGPGGSRAAYRINTEKVKFEDDEVMIRLDT